MRLGGWRDNFSLKAASLALAIGVWFYVHGEERPMMILSVPLELQSLPDDVALTGNVPESVSVRVRAPEVVLKSIQPERMTARVDLSTVAPGDQMVRVPAATITVPNEAEVVKVSPEYLSLHVEKKIGRDVPVTPRVVGEPAPGYVLDVVKVNPERVKVEGPESAVAAVREVMTEVIRIDGRTTPLERLVALFPDRAGVKIDHGTDAVVKVNIHERYVMRLFAGMKVQLRGAAGKVRVDPEKIDVVLEGPSVALNAMTPEDLEVGVDITGEDLSREMQHVQPRVVILRDDVATKVRVRSMHPEEVTVRGSRSRGGR